MLELHTPRLNLRPLNAHDWELFLALHSDPENLRYVCDPLSRMQIEERFTCLLYTSPSPRDRQKSRMPSSA